MRSSASRIVEGWWRQGRRALVGLLKRGSGGAIDAGGEAVLVLCFDPEQALPPVRGAARVTLASDGPLARAADLGGAPATTIELARVGELGAHPHVVVSTLAGVTVRGIAAAIRAGGRVFHHVDPATSRSAIATNAAGALALAARRELERGAGRLLGRLDGASRALERGLGSRLVPTYPSPSATVTATRLAVELRAAPGPAPPSRRRHKVVHVVGGLPAGGAERQLVHVAGGAVEAGHEVSVLTLLPLEGEVAHHQPALTAAGVACRWVGERSRAAPTPPLRDRAGRPLPARLLEAIDGHVAYEQLVPLIELLAADPDIDVVHCWLDYANAIGALAALAAGVERIFVSIRTARPTEAEGLDHPWLVGCYQALALAPAVRFIANSHAGARDYAAWLGLPVERLRVIWNGSALPDDPLEPGERRRRREALGIAEDVVLVVGVFRLSAVKRAGDFLRAIALARREAPTLRAWHIGAGPDEPLARATIRELGLEEVVTLHGRMDDPWSIGELADISLLVSSKEGCPNVSIESQARGIPIVITDTGGSPETVAPDTGILVPVGAVDRIAAALVELSRDPARRRRMGLAGRAFVRSRFSLRTVVEAHRAAYDEPAGGAAVPIDPVRGPEYRPRP